jgi:adenylate kinase
LKRQIILLGPPGSGKGTQAEKLEKNLGLLKISTGDLIRAEISEKTPLGLSVEALVNDGGLVTDEIIVKLFEKAAASTSVGFIADGFPRTLDQAKALTQLISNQKEKSLTYCFFLDLDLETLTKRILGRRVCPKCKQNYNIYFDPPKIPEKCDRDSASLESRKDDQLSVIQNRYKVYLSEIAPVLDYYKDRIVTISANLSSEEVYKNIVLGLNL